MKYRMLTHEELLPLEEDLKAFLIVNGIHHEEWVELNANDPDKARTIVGSFSDAVLQIVYEKLEFLELRSPESCMVFHFGKDELELISINRKAGSDADLTTPESIHKALQQSVDQLTWFSKRKGYTTGRELEIHQLLEQGCVLSTQAFWDALREALVIHP